MESHDPNRELTEALLRFFLKFYGVDKIDPGTHMHEIRALGEQVGEMWGRSCAVCLHEGPIEAGIAFEIRAKVVESKKRALDTVTELYGPGGRIREILSGTQGNPSDEGR
ncbi:hypothetical protein [Pseudomonas sp. ICMP 561]|uniref:hypothetical protein n=1 Tax=Pseudomonas sp. ICMP 561 TaxID=1718918 RepID=UPI0011457C14|nr:hypothetical protein [Pseudomonas sp. ICMP 561]